MSGANQTPSSEKKTQQKKRYYRRYRPKVETGSTNLITVKPAGGTSHAANLQIRKIKSKVINDGESLAYEGVPVGVISRIVGPANFLLYSQFVTLKNFMDRPAIFTYPATQSGATPTFEPPTPVEMCGYYMAAIIQYFYGSSLVDNSSGLNVANRFPNDYAIPNELAHWIKYQALYEKGAIKAETRLSVQQDFTMNTAEILPTSSASINPYNITAMCVTTSQGLDNVGVFPLTQGNATVGDVTLYQVAATYSGLYEGSNPFISSTRLALINTVIKRNFGYVLLKDVGKRAPDLSAWGVGISQSGNAIATGWSNFTAIMNNTDDFDASMTPVLCPNMGAVPGDLEVAGSFLGSIKCVPMGTQLVCQSAQGIPIVSETPMEFQYIQQFIWIAQRNPYFHGKCFGPRGFRLFYDGVKMTVPPMCDWVARTIDYNLLARRALQGLFQYVNMNIQSTPLTTDALCNFMCCFDSMLGDRIQTLGNCLWATGSHPSTSFLPQSLVPNRCTDLAIPLFLKAIFDNVGPNFVNGSFIYPTGYLNCGAIQLTNNTYQYWSKGGLIPNVGGNRFEGQVTGSSFSNSPFQIPVNTFFSGNSSTFTPYAGGGGYATVSIPGYNEVYTGQLASSTATAYLNAALALPLLGGYSPNFVYWFAGVATMWDGVMGFLKLRNLNAKAVTGSQHLGWGGPGMSSTVVFAPQASGAVSQGGTTTPIIDLTNGPGSAVLIQSNINNVYDMWAPRRVSTIAPMSKRDVAIAQAYGPCSYYVLSGSLAPADVRSPVFVASLVSVSGHQVYQAFLDELIGTETSLIEAYMKNRSSQHTRMGDSSGIVAITKGKKEAVPDCLRLPFTAIADSISSSMESVDEWTSFIPVPAVARSLWKMSSSALHHYSVAGSKVNAYFKKRRQAEKLKQAKKDSKVFEIDF